jgi:hypothetical protein
MNVKQFGIGALALAVGWTCFGQQTRVQTRREPVQQATPQRIQQGRNRIRAYDQSSKDAEKSKEPLVHPGYQPWPPPPPGIPWATTHSCASAPGSSIRQQTTATAPPGAFPYAGTYGRVLVAPERLQWSNGAYAEGTPRFGVAWGRTQAGGSWTPGRQQQQVQAYAGAWQAPDVQCRPQYRRPCAPQRPMQPQVQEQQAPKAQSAQPQLMSRGAQLRQQQQQRNLQRRR